MVPPKISGPGAEYRSRKYRYLADVERLNKGLLQDYGVWFAEVLELIEDRIVAAAKRGGSARQLRRTQRLIATQAGKLFNRLAGSLDDARLDVLETAMDFAVSNYNALAGAELLALPSLSAAGLKGVLNKTPIGKYTAKSWWEAQRLLMTSEVQGIVDLGISQNWGVDSITRQVRDVMTGSRWHEVERTVRTGVASAQNRGSLLAYEEGAGLITAVEHDTALDTRTCRTCMALDGLRWSLPDYQPINHSQEFNGGPPGNTHPNCRCGSDPVTSLSDVPAGSRAALDDVAGGTKGEAWLRTQDADLQREVISNDAIRDLWIKRKITLIQAVTTGNDPMSLDEFRRKNKSLFK